MAKHSRPAAPPAAHSRPAQAFFKTIAVNRRARHEYFIEETLEAGLELHGSEVKSLRTSRVDFADSYARVENGECWLIGLRLSTYEKTHVQVPLPDRPRRLLLHKREIAKLQTRSERSGYTLVPLELYFHNRWAKVKLGLARGKAEYDKRQALKAGESKREISRVLKNARRG